MHACIECLTVDVSYTLMDSTLIIGCIKYFFRETFLHHWLVEVLGLNVFISIEVLAYML
jgi:hypothetical protein